MPANYDDGIYSLRRARITRSPLPLPRLIGNRLQQLASLYDAPPAVIPNTGSFFFGQYMSHDVSANRRQQNRKHPLHIGLIAIEFHARCTFRGRRRCVALLFEGQLTGPLRGHVVPKLFGNKCARRRSVLCAIRWRLFGSGPIGDDIRR